MTLTLKNSNKDESKFQECVFLLWVQGTEEQIQNLNKFFNDLMPGATYGRRFKNDVEDSNESDDEIEEMENRHRFRNVFE